MSQSDPLANPIEAEILIMDERYEKFHKIKRKAYDYAVLKLSLNSIIKEEFVLKCNFNYSFATYQQNLICIPGYPIDTEIKALKLKA